MTEAVTPPLLLQAPPHKLLSINTTAAMVTLPDLKAWTWYCVRAQTCYDYYEKMSDFTAPHCMQTEGEVFSPDAAEQGLMGKWSQPHHTARTSAAVTSDPWVTN